MSVCDRSDAGADIGAQQFVEQAARSRATLRAAGGVAALRGRQTATDDRPTETGRVDPAVRRPGIDLDNWN